MTESLASRTTLIVPTVAGQIEVVAEGNGPLVVLLPSLGRESYDYDDVATGLAGKGFSVARPQPRGIGRSVGPTEGITLHDLADDVRAVIEYLGAPEAVVLGHAFGHYVARTLGADRPDLVRGVVVAAGGARDYPAELTQLAVKCADVSVPDDERRTLLNTAFFAPGNSPDGWLDGWYPDVSKSQLAAAAATPKSQWWDIARQPILDLQAELDPFRPRETALELRDRFGAIVSLAFVPNARHALLPEAPDRVVQEITSWIHTVLP